MRRTHTMQFPCQPIQGGVKPAPGGKNRTLSRQPEALRKFMRKTIEPYESQICGWNQSAISLRPEAEGIEEKLALDFARLGVDNDHMMEKTKLKHGGWGAAKLVPWREAERSLRATRDTTQVVTLPRLRFMDEASEVTEEMWNCVCPRPSS